MVKQSKIHKIASNGHPRGSEVISIEKVRDCDDCENVIKATFDQKFTQLENIGREYYEGNIREMKEEFRRICDENNYGKFVLIKLKAKPTSPIKKNEFPKDSILKMLINFVKNHISDDSQAFLWKEFYDSYVELVGTSGEIINLTSFSRNLQKILDKKLITCTYFEK